MMENFEKVGVEIEEERLDRMVLVSVKNFCLLLRLRGSILLTLAGCLCENRLFEFTIF